jgi:DNA-binding transcriptional regulator YhcF (GntR family)
MTYRDAADAVQSEIVAGRLRPGDRLPPQREFADARKLAASTAARVYA